MYRLVAISLLLCLLTADRVQAHDPDEYPGLLHLWPKSKLFAPLIADPKEIRSFVSALDANTGSLGRQLAAIGIGNEFGVLAVQDFNGNGIVDPQDFSLLKSVFGLSEHPDQDLNCNGIVDPADFSLLKTYFGQPPGPSGLSPD